MGERSDNRWEEISYEQAMDDILQLKTVIDQYGPRVLRYPLPVGILKLHNQLIAVS